MRSRNNKRSRKAISSGRDGVGDGGGAGVGGGRMLRNNRPHRATKIQIQSRRRNPRAVAEAGSDGFGGDDAVVAAAIRAAAVRPARPAVSEPRLPRPACD